SCAQYTVNGNAQQISCNCYNLTNETNNQSGSVWNNNKIDLSQSFDFNFSVNLGRFDSNGADGMVFVLQPISTSVGSTGGGLGYDGISPAVGITLDTYQNGNNSDPAYDHIAIQLNGDLNHTPPNNIAGPVTIIDGNDNAEDNLDHSLRIVWDATAKSLTVYVDGSMRVSATKDLVTDVFAGNPMVYWGFTGGTGALYNLQKFCTALNPTFHFAATQKRCVNEPITFYDSTISFTTIAKIYWDFGDGSPIDSIHLNPVHVYATGGDYTVKQTVVGADGCQAINTQAVRVGSKYISHFTHSNDYCIPMPPWGPTTFTDSSYGGFGNVFSYNWDFGSGMTPIASTAVYNFTTPGNKTIAHCLKTVEGCDSDTSYQVIHFTSPPMIDCSFTDS
ncbi:MAG TPA: PKD domain-containing protein, partial [Ferruginibacter sp.]|nr:PKD domain-containing protein [Ferruginibacter sp.]